MSVFTNIEISLHLWPLFVLTLINPLSNNPGKKGSNFICCSAKRFPHIEMFSFLRKECINLQKGILWKKMYLNSSLKRVFFLVKRFRSIIRVANNSHELFTILHDPHIGFLCYLRLRRDFVMRKLDRKKGTHIQCCFAKMSLNLMFNPIRTLVETIVVKLAPFCIPRFSRRFGPFVFIWAITQSGARGLSLWYNLI